MLWKLFKATFTISAFTFGGGYVIVPLMKKNFVENLKWIDEEEMIDLVALAQTSPGAIAVNTSIAIGYRIKGLVGALVALVATVLPPMCILMGMFVVYDVLKGNQIVTALLEGMQVGVCAVIIDVVIDLVLGIRKQKNIVSWLSFVWALVLTTVFNVNILIVIVVMTLFGLIANFIARQVTT